MSLFVSFLSFQIHCLLYKALIIDLNYKYVYLKGKKNTIEKMYKKPRKDGKQVLL